MGCDSRTGWPLHFECLEQAYVASRPAHLTPTSQADAWNDGGGAPWRAEGRGHPGEVSLLGQTSRTQAGLIISAESSTGQGHRAESLVPFCVGKHHAKSMTVQTTLKNV